MTYGCYNRPSYKPEVRTDQAELAWANGTPHVVPVTRSWPHVFTTDCQYTKSNLGKTDPQCVGCKWREE